MNLRRLLPPALVLVALGVIAVAVFSVRAADPAWASGRVVGASGSPVAGAAVASDAGALVVTDDDGRFVLPVPDPGAWVTVTADGWLRRTRAVQPGGEVTVRLAADPPGTVLIAFGGDVMFGRRYYDPNEDGDTGDGLLHPGADVDEHQRLLDGVAPLLATADLTVINLESPLASDPYFDPNKQRPGSFHQEKEFVFASEPAAAEALAGVGVDVINLGNNHIYDVLDGGVETTLSALADAGFVKGDRAYGAGVDLDDAWTPAVLTVDGQRIGLLGCTSITGEEHRHSYVAEPDKGGAAPCDPERLVDEVQALAPQVDTTIVMIHGGYEYERDPSPRIRSLTEAASEAGADLVINHHPHVVGGLSAGPSRFVAWTLGNLLFDQTIWPTFDSYVLFAAVRDGVVLSAWLEPIRHQGFLPVGVVGDDADWVAHGTLARSDGGWIVEDGSLWWDATSERAPPVPIAAEFEPGAIGVVRSGCARAGPGLDVGRDLLWTGHFEDHDIAATDGGALWNVDGRVPDRALSTHAALEGDHGVRLRRAGGRRTDVVLSPTNRVLVAPGTSLSLVLAYRSDNPDAGSVQLSWYNDTRGESQAQTVIPLEGGRGWRWLRVDVTAPANAVAVQPFIRLRPPGPDLAILDVDQIRLIAWGDTGGCQLVRSATADQVILVATGPDEAEGPTLEVFEAAPRSEVVGALPVPVAE